MQLNFLRAHVSSVTFISLCRTRTLHVNAFMATFSHTTGYKTLKSICLPVTISLFQDMCHCFRTCAIQDMCHSGHVTLLQGMRHSGHVSIFQDMWHKVKEVVWKFWNFLYYCSDLTEIFTQYVKSNIKHLLFLKSFPFRA